MERLQQNLILNNLPFFGRCKSSSVKNIWLSIQLRRHFWDKRSSIEQSILKEFMHTKLIYIFFICMFKVVFNQYKISVHTIIAV